MALTKKIDELDSYGSVDSEKRKKDLFEVEKNEGTYLSPSYLVGGSRKITQEELENMLGYVPYSNPNCEIVKNNGTPEENGTRLIQALLICYTKTPNSLALSATNRAVVYVLSGKYNIGASILNVSKFVDIIGIGSAESILIYGNTGNSIFFIEDDNDYCFENFTIENTSTGKSLTHNFGQTDYGVWDNIRLLTATNRDIVWNGKYNKITGLVDEVFIGSLGVDCVISNSTFKNKSCGYSETAGVDISGKIINCFGIDYCFGYSSFSYLSIDGVIEGTDGRDYCFGVTIDDSTGVSLPPTGRINNCKSRNRCFISTTSNFALVNIEGKIDNCIANSLCFGYTSNAINQSLTGSVYNCQIGGVTGLVHSSPNGHKWRKYLGNDGEWQTEDLGI